MPDEVTIPHMKCAEGSWCDKKATWNLEEQSKAHPNVTDEDRKRSFACDEHLASVITGFVQYEGLGAILVWVYETGE